MILQATDIVADEWDKLPPEVRRRIVDRATARMQAHAERLLTRAAAGIWDWTPLPIRRDTSCPFY